MFFDRFSALQKFSQDKMQQNQAAIGLHSDLSKKAIPELDELLDQVTLAVHECLNGIKVTQHAGLTSAFGFQYPHLAEADEVTGQVQEQGDGMNGTYQTEGADVVVVEDMIVDPEGFQTL
jgi:hypothetical protein